MVMRHTASAGGDSAEVVIIHRVVFMAVPLGAPVLLCYLSPLSSLRVSGFPCSTTSAAIRRLRCVRVCHKKAIHNQNQGVRSPGKDTTQHPPAPAAIHPEPLITTGQMQCVLSQHSHPPPPRPFFGPPQPWPPDPHVAIFSPTADICAGLKQQLLITWVMHPAEWRRT